MYLLCSDFHLDDNSANEYRWNVFGEIARVCQSKPISCIYCLGDMSDKSDRFSAKMVNRLVQCWMSLPADKKILRGNHDTLITGPAFWEFLSSIDGIEYVTQPTLQDDLLLLPFSANPKGEWDGLPLRNSRSIFIHATRAGAIAENGYALVGQDLPRIPRNVRVYSGDVHTQQVVDNWTYVGASHPVKYGDRYACRFLLLDEHTYGIVAEVPVDTIDKRSITIGSLSDLTDIDTRPGDQVKVNCSISPGALDWGTFERAIDEWARQRDVKVVFGECSYDLPLQTGEASSELEPEELLRAFAQEEEVADDLLDVGIELLREVAP